MPFDSNGVFSRVMNWTSDQQNGIAIECGRHDAEDDNFAQGFNDCFCRDGRAAATGDFNLGNYKVKNVADGTATTDAVNKGQMDTAITSNQSTITTAYQNYVKTMLSTLYPVGSIYIGTQTTCPLTTLIAGSQWQLVSTSIITSVNSNVPVKGTGKSMGITGGGLSDGSGTSSGSWISGTGGSGDKRITIAKNSYNLALNDTSHSTKDISGGRAIGLVTNANNSGIVGTVTSSSLAVNIWKRTA